MGLKKRVAVYAPELTEAEYATKLAELTEAEYATKLAPRLAAVAAELAALRTPKLPAEHREKVPQGALDQLAAQIGRQAVEKILKLAAATPLAGPPIQVYTAAKEFAQRKDRSPVVFELHLHKIQVNRLPDRPWRWFLTGIRRFGPEPDADCRPEECCIISCEIIGAEYLQADENGALGYTDIDPVLLAAERSRLRA